MHDNTVYTTPAEAVFQAADSESFGELFEFLG
jgi:hypothetical protein